VGYTGADAGAALGSVTVTATVDGVAIRAWVEEFARLISTNKEKLTELDSAIGDGDHGINMDRGMAAVVKALADWTPAALLKKTATTLVSTVGGASGPLYGTAFLRMATAAGDASEMDAQGFAAMLRAGLDGVVARGKAEPGDKTMVDALAPAVDALDAAVAGGAQLGPALQTAFQAATKGQDGTIPMVARKGRASYLGERSAGHQDPGAISVTLLITAAVTALGDKT
jgi:phosphoenolpyruvate---glycerone phosphotransferase subunit DhaL